MAAVVEWASNANYVGGGPGVVGTPTKIEPTLGVTGDGIVPGGATGSQFLNYTLNEITKALIGVDARELELFTIPDSRTFSTAGFTVSHQDNMLGGGDRFNIISSTTSYLTYTMAQIDTSNEHPFVGTATPQKEVATDGTTIVALTFSDFRNQIKQFDGAFLTPVVNLATEGNPNAIVYDADNARMLISYNSQFIVALTGVNYTTKTVFNTGIGTALGARGMASITGGLTLLSDDTGTTIDFYSLLAGGFAVLVGTLPIGTGTNVTSDIKATKNFFFMSQVESVGPDSVLRIYRSTSGGLWTRVQTFLGDGGPSISSPALFTDPYSNALYSVFAAFGAAGGSVISVSKDQGTTWSTPVRSNFQGFTLSASGGYLWGINNGSIARSSVRLPEDV